MQAISQSRYGLGETLELVDIPKPVPKSKEVLVKVSAASVDAGVLHLMTGDIPMVRLIFGIRAPRSRPGISFSGTVAEVGSEVTGFEIDQTVFGTGSGAFAEFALAKQDKLAVLPKGSDLALASTLSVSASTALQAVRDYGKIKSGQRVLVTGASGGVGSFAVQFAAQQGAIVTGVCTSDKQEFVSRLGASKIIDYKLEKIDGVYDVIIDIASPLSLKETRKLLAPGGTLVIVGVASKHGSSGMGRNLGASFISNFVKESLVWVMHSENKDDLEKLSALLAQGKIKSVVDKVFPLQQTREAVEFFTSGKTKGKVVIQILP
ncbi:MAG: NAD(P)-dependent alcohol dehydrogenase [Actinomycetales bacterium]